MILVFSILLYVVIFLWAIPLDMTFCDNRVVEEGKKNDCCTLLYNRNFFQVIDVARGPVILSNS